MAIFGVPEKDEEHAIRAVRCGLSILNKHSKFISDLPNNKKFNIRIGIESGEVIAGYMGSSKRLEYTAMGYAVVAAKRIESLTKPNSIYIGRETYRKICHRFKIFFVGILSLQKGEGEIEVWEVLRD